MSKITFNENPKPAWTKYVTIELSKREAALLGFIMGKANGRHKIVQEIYEAFEDISPETPITGPNIHVDLNSLSWLSGVLDKIGEE